MSPDKIVLDLKRVNSFNRKMALEQEDNKPAAGADKPSYMSHTVCSLEHIRRNGGGAAEIAPESPTKPTPAQLTRTNSQRATSSPRRKSSTSSEAPAALLNGGPQPSHAAAVATETILSDQQIEDIFDVTVLQTLLDSVVGYEQRRRIRSQIRVAKKQRLDEQAVAAVPVTNKGRTNVAVADAAPRPRASEPAQPSVPAYLVPKKTPAAVVAPRKPVEVEKKPVWATQNILKKPSTEPPAVRRHVAKKPLSSTTTTSASAHRSHTSTASTTASTATKRSNGAGDLDVADCVTSSYGIGPTDETGKPLFGISALKRGASGRNFKVPAVVETTVTEVTTVATPECGRSNGKSAMFGLSALRRQRTEQEQADGDEPCVTAKQVTQSTQARSVAHSKDGRMSTATASQQQSVTTTTTTTSGDSRSKKISLSSLDEFANKLAVNADADDGVDGGVEGADASGPSRSTETRSFINSSGSKVTGFRDVMERMQNADNGELDIKFCHYYVFIS